jgi:hypothetical protein
MSDSNKNDPSENEIESPVDGPIPDWMRMATASSSSPSLTEETTPDWLKAIQSGKSPSKSEPAPEPAETEDSYAGMSDLERLLAEEGIDLGSVAEERPSGASGMSVRDWMISTSEDEMIRKKVGAEPLEEEEEALIPEPAETEDSYAGMSDLERLLAEEGIDLGSVAEERPSGASGMSVRDWMISTSEDEMIRKKVGAEPLEEEEEALIPEEPIPAAQPVQAKEDDKMVVEEDLPDWLREVDLEEETSAVPAPTTASGYDDKIVAEEDLPDWLRDTEEEPTPIEFGGDEGLPDWLRDTEEEEAEAPVGAAISEAGSEDDKMIVEDDLPDWLRDVEEEPASVSEPVAAVTAKDDKLVVEEDLPDWLRDVEEESLAPSFAETVAATEAGDLVAEEELPDWLRDVQEEEAEEIPVAAALETDEEDLMLDKDDLPDWLKEVQAEADKEPPVAEAMMAGTAAEFTDEDLPDWLREVEEEEVEPAASTPLLSGLDTSDRMIDEGLPDWLREVEEEETPEPEGVVANDGLVAREELPDWLSEVQTAEDEAFEPSEPSPEEPAEVVEEDLPDWLREVEEEVPVEALDLVEAEAETEGEVETEEMEVEPAVTAVAAPSLVSDSGLIEEEELPDWLRQVEETRDLAGEEEPEEAIAPALEEAAAPAVAAGVFATTEAVVEEAVVAEPEPEPVPVSVAPVASPLPQPVSTAEMPDWLKKLREGQEETPPTPAPIPTPVSVATAQPVVIPRPVAPEPAPVVAEVQPKAPVVDADKLLEMARIARAKGNLDESVSMYDNLIASGIHLDSVIEDMRQSIKAFPANHLLYQIMGDAMMKDGRLQAALDAYRQGLARLSK